MPHNRPMRLPVLTMAALDVLDWEPALTFPFPANPDVALLFKARDQVIEFLECMANDLAQDDPEGAARGIQRAAARLIEIAALTPAAVDVDIAASLDIAARFVATQREKSLKGFRRIEVQIGIKGFLDSLTED